MVVNRPLRYQPLADYDQGKMHEIHPIGCVGKVARSKTLAGRYPAKESH